MIHRIPWTLEELDRDGCSVNGAELMLTVEVDKGQRGQFSGPPEDCCEEIPPSCVINNVEIVSATIVCGECKHTTLTNEGRAIAAVKAWIAWSHFETNQRILDQLLEKISESECDAAEAAAEDEYERGRDR